MASISITYTPQITSSVINSSPFICHRVCYRVGSSGSYCCIEDLSDSIAGTPKTFDITISAAPCASVPDVDEESCTNTVYEGYVQACCEDISSTAGRVAWSASFVADPTCVNKLVCCIAQRTLINSYTQITDTGSDYDNTLSPLSILVVRHPSDPVASSVPNNATIQATIAGGVITGLTVTAGGLYGMTPLLVIPSPTLGSPGTTATAIAVIPCTDGSYIGNCETSPQEVVATELLLGECANMCFPEVYAFIFSIADLTGPPDTTNYSYTAGGCCDCSTCRNYTVVVNSILPSIDICYTSCTVPGNGAEQVCATYIGSGSHNINCVVPGSIYSPDDADAIVSITDNGACGSCP